MLHKDATYKTYKSFLEHVSTELDSEIEEVELRVSQTLEFGSDEEKAMTKAIEHVFPSASRYLCTKHLKDNLKNHMQNKVGMDKKERNKIMDALFGTDTDSLTNADSTHSFESLQNDILSDVQQNYPAFSSYLEKKMLPNLKKCVYEPKRKNGSDKLWTNNNAESLNNILKNCVNWQPKHTAELIEKVHSITDLHFMDYRSALHQFGNYRLVHEESMYMVRDSLWRCKTEDEKVKLFQSFLKDTKKKSKGNYIRSGDGKYEVPVKAKGVAKKKNQGPRARNERANKR